MTTPPNKLDCRVIVGPAGECGRPARWIGVADPNEKGFGLEGIPMCDGCAAALDMVFMVEIKPETVRQQDSTRCQRCGRTIDGDRSEQHLEDECYLLDRQEEKERWGEQ